MNSESPSHCVVLWVSGEIPEDYDWEKMLPEGVRLIEDGVSAKAFPWKDVHHEITWWITRRLTLQEWSDLDDAESSVLSLIVGDDNFMGHAGPIPLDDLEEEINGRA